MLLTRLFAQALCSGTWVFSPWRRRSPVIVLCHHSIRDDGEFSSWMRTPASLFRRQLERLRQLGVFIGPEEIRQSPAPPRGGLRFLLTFDDGYADNLHLASPILEELSAPALFFVSTHHVATGEPFWFDRVVTPIQAANIRRLDLTRFGLGVRSFAPVGGARRWEDIQRLLADLKRLGAPADDRAQAALDEIERAAGPGSRQGVGPRPLLPNELSALAKNPARTLGSHGHRHEILTTLSDAALGESLNRSREELTRMTGRVVVDLAYPNGDHDDRVVEACRRAGFRSGFSCRPAVVRENGDPFRIPRLLVGGFDSPAALAGAVLRTLALSALAAVRRVKPRA